MFTATNPTAEMGIIQLLSEMSADVDRFDYIVREHYERCDIHEVRLVISTMMSLLYTWKKEHEEAQKGQSAEE